MQYRNLVKRVADYSGFSDDESEMVLCLLTETLATRLNEGERKDFASQLPKELREITLEVNETVKSSVDDIYETFIQLQDIDKGRARKQIMAAWLALKDALSPGEVSHIRAQLPNDLVAEPH